MRHEIIQLFNHKNAPSIEFLHFYLTSSVSYVNYFMFRCLLSCIILCSRKYFCKLAVILYSKFVFKIIQKCFRKQYCELYDIVGATYTRVVIALIAKAATRCLRKARVLLHSTHIIVFMAYGKPSALKILYQRHRFGSPSLQVEWPRQTIKPSAAGPFELIVASPA